MTTLHVLHTNDFHNTLTQGQAQAIGRAKAELAAAGKDVLLLDAGDAVKAGNLGVTLGGERVLAWMSQAGYDAMTMGNRESHVADALLRQKIADAAFPVLCANLRWREDRGETLPTVPHVVRALPSGLRAGVFGLTVPMVTDRMATRRASAFLWDLPLTAARAQIAALRPQVDVLIALTHIGLGEDERLAASCPELDLIVGGHTHAILSEPRVVGGVPIVQAGGGRRRATYLGRVALDWDEPGQKPRVVGRLELLGD